MIEIERKFLVANLPDLSTYPCVAYERFYLPSKDGEEIRVQKKGATYELEHKLILSNLSRETEKQTLTKAKYEELKLQAGESIVRNSYDLGDGLTVKIYKGRFEGLIRAEKEFADEQGAARYRPEGWLGEEITHTPLAKDKSLIALSDEEFRSLLASLGSNPLGPFHIY